MLESELFFAFFVSLFFKSKTKPTARRRRRRRRKHANVCKLTKRGGGGRGLIKDLARAANLLSRGTMQASAFGLEGGGAPLESCSLHYRSPAV